jgi:hypothetical protein
MSLAPETATSTLQQAPPDRPTAQLDQLLKQALAIMLGDNKLDDNEMQSVHEFMQQLALAAQGGGIGNGAPPPNGAGQGPGPSPMDMNQNVQDMGTVDGATPMDSGTGGY